MIELDIELINERVRLRELQTATLKFIDSFEVVFSKDWDYTYSTLVEETRLSCFFEGVVKGNGGSSRESLYANYLELLEIVLRLKVESAKFDAQNWEEILNEFRERCKLGQPDPLLSDFFTLLD